MIFYLMIAAVVALHSMIYDNQSNGGLKENFSEFIASLIYGILWPVAIYNKLFGGK